MGMARDITEQKQAEEALSKAKEEWERTFDAVPDMITVIDADHRILRVNRAAAEYLKLAPSQYVGQPCYVCLHGSDRPHPSCPHAKAREDGRQYIAEIYDERLGRHLLISASPLFDSRRRVIGCVHVARDVTERKRAEEALQAAHDELEERVQARTALVTATNRELRLEVAERKRAEEALRRSEASLKSAQRVARMGSWEWNIGSNELEWSDEVYRIFGLKREHFAATYDAFLELVHPDDRELVTRHVDAALREDVPYSIDHRVVLPGGEVRYVHEQAEVARDADGHSLRMVGTVIDVTARKRAEAALRRAERLSAIGTLAAGIAHEINNPLASALLAAETALAIKGVPGKSQLFEECLEEIVVSLDRCGKVVRNVLMFSRDEISERQLVQVNDVICQAGDLTRSLAGRRGVEVQLDLHGGPPRVLANPLELELVLVNLIRNAIEVSDRPNPVVVRTRVDGPMVRIEVRDRGRGMTPEEKKRLFDPFFTTRSHEGGTGLGASIVYGIVETHQGKLLVESQVGKGTVVAVVLPAAESPPEVKTGK